MESAEYELVAKWSYLATGDRQIYVILFRSLSDGNRPGYDRVPCHEKPMCGDINCTSQGQGILGNLIVLSMTNPIYLKC